MDVQGRYTFLVVSDRDKHRGPFTVHWLEEACKSMDLDAIILSAGLDVKSADTRHPQQRSYAVTAEMVRDADVIIGMEQAMINALERKYTMQEDAFLVCVDVPGKFHATYVDEAVMRTYSPAQAVSHVKHGYQNAFIGPQLFAKVLEYHLMYLMGLLKRSQAAAFMSGKLPSDAQGKAL